VATDATKFAAYFADGSGPVFDGDAPLEKPGERPTQWGVMGEEGPIGPLPGRVLLQKQAALYTVVWHPIGGKPDAKQLCAVCDALQKLPETEMRLAPDQTAYIINLTGDQAKQMMALTPDSARTRFETSVACIGSTICQVGLRDSQALLRACVDMVRQAELPDGALPKIYISGCPSSCGTHQTGTLGFRGGVKMVDGKPQSAFVLYADGCQLQGSEAFGRELGAIEESRIPSFLVELGKAVAATGLDYADWKAANPEGLDAIAAPYLA
jgi:ferredoxin-nitrite reductase